MAFWRELFVDAGVFLQCDPEFNEVVGTAVAPDSLFVPSMEIKQRI